MVLFWLFFFGRSTQGREGKVGGHFTLPFSSPHTVNCFITNPKSILQIPKKTEANTFFTVLNFIFHFPLVWTRPWNQSTVSHTGNIPQLCPTHINVFFCLLTFHTQAKLINPVSHFHNFLSSPNIFSNTPSLSSLWLCLKLPTQASISLMMMAPPSRSCHLQGLNIVAITVVFILFLSVLPSISGKIKKATIY